jgi:NAD(P)-dependent dehydrogenase (short-subunit alcohol dehydrogenase family)
MTDLNQKVAFITGGASGIGLGIAHAAARAGMKVAIADIRQDHIDAALPTFPAGAAVKGYQLDVTDRAAYAAVADAVERDLGPVWLLVNNAGVAVAGPAHLASWDDWDWTMGVNLGGVINGVKIFLPRLVERKAGHIVSTASMSGLLPHPGTITYTTAKAAIIGMMESLASELGPQGIGVSAFCPGPVQSDIHNSGETRPAHLGDTGYGDSDKRRQSGGAMQQHLFKPADEIGERVIEGVRNNELYLLTHSEFADGVKARAAAIVASVPTIPQNEELKSTYGMLMWNPIHEAERERQDKLKGRS